MRRRLGLTSSTRTSPLFLLYLPCSSMATYLDALSEAPPGSVIPVASETLNSMGHSSTLGSDIKIPPSSIPEGIPSAPAVPYATRFKASLRNLKKMSASSFLDDGTPVGYIVAQCHGLLPPASVVYHDLNPIWEKFGNISMRKISDFACMIFIPSVQTREWVLQVGFWNAGHCSFTVSPWTLEFSLETQELKSALTWAILKNVPPMLYSLDGISVIASTIREPLHTEKSHLDAIYIGQTKVKVEIMLDSSPPESIVIRDSQGNSAMVSVSYPSLPPKCSNCG
ncbi:unnamed protein product, partial [Thlaspi arvense]